MTLEEFQKDILQGIPDELPPKPEYDHSVNHAPIRKDILSAEEKSWLLKMHFAIFQLNITRF